MTPDTPSLTELDDLWARHSAAWRDTAQVTSAWQDAADLNPDLLRYEADDAFWETLAEAGVMLLVTREYEHLVLALAAPEGQPHISYWAVPHPSGITVDRARSRVYVASTRNPNQVYTLRPVTGFLPRGDVPLDDLSPGPLVPVASQFYPGALYIHELEMVGGALHANSVGQNAVVRLSDDAAFDYVWHPRCVEQVGAPVIGQNHIQLNSIAAGPTIDDSFFSASSTAIETLRPGDPDYPVDGRGVIFSGKTREPLVQGLTRPHSARLHDGALWVDNSGYGEVWRADIDTGAAEVVARLPGWTRGLAFYEGLAFVGTSRVIPRFAQYAPGLDVERSQCGLHILDRHSGAVRGSLHWPYGNQIFNIVWLPVNFCAGLPFPAQTARDAEREKRFFYAFQTNTEQRKSETKE